MATFSPALGSKASVGASSTFQFLAVAETGRLSNGSSLEVWTDLSGSWQEHAFQEHSTAFGSMLVARVPVAGEGSYQFTYRIREASGDIAWLSRAAGNDNGVLLIRQASSASAFDPLANADESLQIVHEDSNNDIDTRIIRYSLNDGYEGAVESFRIITLGAWSSGLAIERSKPTWFTARSLNAISGLSPNADCQLLLYQSGSQVAACFPLSLADASSTLRGCSQGSDTVWLRSERDTSASAQAQCVLTWGPDNKLLEVIDACTAAAKKAVDASGKEASQGLLNGSVASPTWSLHETTKAIYCTWNSLGQDYRYSGVVQRLKALRSDGNLGYFESLLLDDGWQDVARSPENQNLRGLRSFGLRDGWLDEDIAIAEGESKLAAAVRTLKEQFPEIKRIGVWMTLQGYWNGLHPDSEISRNYKLTRYGVRDNQAQHPYPPPFEHIYLPSPEDTKAYWTDYLVTLKQAGVDFVKIDNQAALDYLVGEGAAAMRGDTSRTARAVAAQVFGPGNLINCMAGSPRYYNAFLSKASEPAASLRTSDDFFPNEPDSHRFHIAHNATTALLDRKLAVTRDFDMFTTHHNLAEFHALLRCFSTGPMYITDSEPSDKQILKRLGGPDPHGNYRIVKATTDTSVRLPSAVLTDVTANGDGPALKVALSVSSANGVILGVWNCRGEGGVAVDVLTRQEISEALSIGSHDKTINKRYVIMYGIDSTHAVVDLDGNKHDTSSIVLPIHLNPGMSKAITVAQVETFAAFDMAVLGLADKFVGLCSVVEVMERESTPKEETPKVNSHREADPSTQDKQAVNKASEGTAKSTPSQPAPPTITETTPLLPTPTVSTSPRRTGSRLLALLLFYRRDLHHARSAFFRDFLKAPFKTLFSELRAIFGGASTLPAVDSEDQQGDNGFEAARDMQETDQAMPKAYSTLETTPTSPLQHEGDLSVASDSPNATAVDRHVADDQVTIKLAVAGKLLLWVPDFSSEAFSLTLQRQPIPEKMISVSGSSVIIDMEGASQALGLEGTSGSAWEIGVSKN